MADIAIRGATKVYAGGAVPAVAAEVRDEVAAYLADAVALIAQTVDPQIIVLGGGVAEAGPPLLDTVVDALHARAERSPVLAALDLAGRVALVPEGIPPGALGGRPTGPRPSSRR